VLAGGAPDLAHVQELLAMPAQTRSITRTSIGNVKAIHQKFTRARESSEE